MKDLSVVFDTNAYRNLCSRVSSSDRLTGNSLRESEQRRNISAFANPYVLMELASHLWDKSDPHYDQCRCALAGLYEHCRESGGKLRILADSESLVAQMLYNRVPLGHEETAEKLAQLARAVALMGAELDPSVSAMCKVLADHVMDVERVFVNDMRAAIHHLNPVSTGWNPFSDNQSDRLKALALVRGNEASLRIAGMLVVKARLLLGIPVHDAQFEEMSRAVLEQLPVSIALYRQILDRIVTTGCDVSKKKRANWIWDIQIVMGTGRALQNGLPELVLVTGDKAMADSAKEVGLDSHVVSLPEYLSAVTQ